MPRVRPPFPVERGLWGKPTVINNVETLSAVPSIVRHGGAWYAGYGTGKSRGTKVFALAGKVNNTGLIEVPLGITVREVIEEIGGGIVAVDDGRVVAECALPVAGLLSVDPLDDVIAQSRGANEAAAALGWIGGTPFLTMSFLALSVIPSLKITDRGLVDVDQFELVPLTVA
jgi:NADH:ubiquinone oxidoreductase subunit F (NADH-binding)